MTGARQAMRQRSQAARALSPHTRKTSMSVSAATAGRMSTAGSQNLPFIIAASSFGTLIEWYDFYLYGVLVGFFAGHFFPANANATLTFLASLGIFWTGFVVRPFGAVFIGVLAPILLVACRVVQGLALGGEYGGAATYIAEHAPDGKRGLYTSWIQTT